MAGEHTGSNENNRSSKTILRVTNKNTTSSEKDFDIKRLILAVEKLSTAIQDSNTLNEKKFLLEKKKFINEIRINETKDTKTNG
jgi:hypothetical protein